MRHSHTQERTRLLASIDRLESGSGVEHRLVECGSSGTRPPGRTICGGSLSNEGIGKREPRKHGFRGYWSRRITEEHRLVSKIEANEIRIAACRYHYSG